MDGTQNRKTIFQELVNRASGLLKVKKLRDLVRFDFFFAVTIFFPTLLLSYFALSSIQAQELSFDADLNLRSAAIRVHVEEQKQSLFKSFEERVEERLSRGRSPVADLANLSPHLLAAFAMDSEGKITAPFRLPEPARALEPSNAYKSNLFLGLRIEQKAKKAESRGFTREAQELFRTAASSYRAARSSTWDPRLQGQAHFSEARVLTLAGTENPEDAFGDIIALYGKQRDERGFRLSDLARIMQANIGLQRDKDAGLYAMRELVDQLLSETWTIGEAGEAQIAVRALGHLERLRSEGAEIDAGWISQSTNRLEERKRQLFWSRVFLDEVYTVFDYASGDTDTMRYIATSQHPDQLWATFRHEQAVFVFRFDKESILQQLAEKAGELASLDPDIQSTVRSASSSDGPNFQTTNLGPQLPYEELVVALSNPKELASRKRRNRTIRIIVIFLAIGMTLLGIFLSTRLVAREIESARTKADFAANVSHELRSPITHIRLKGEALQLGLCFNDEERQDHYDAIVRESERLSRLVDNVLDFSAIERGAKRYIFRPEDVKSLLEGTMLSITGSFEIANATIELELDDALPVVWVDREAISQVIINLVSNAVKYGGDEKYVQLSAQLRQKGIEISVSDRGIGIAPDETDKVFGNFYRSTDKNVRKEKGTGIGLTIVRYIVTAHGGTISVKSTLGKGTTFSIQLPLGSPEGTGV